LKVLMTAVYTIGPATHCGGAFGPCEDRKEPAGPGAKVASCVAEAAYLMPFGMRGSDEPVPPLVAGSGLFNTRVSTVNEVVQYGGPPDPLLTRTDMGGPVGNEPCVLLLIAY